MRLFVCTHRNPNPTTDDNNGVTNGGGGLRWLWRRQSAKIGRPVAEWTRLSPNPAKEAADRLAGALIGGERQLEESLES
ncbi:hypothetical protein R6Q59_028074 [Mikania micrantha]